MANKSREQKQACVQAIIELTREKGRLTVKGACVELIELEGLLMVVVA